MQQLPKRIHFGSASKVCVRESGDKLIIDAAGHHRRILDDMLRGHLIRLVYRLARPQRDALLDYMDPLAAIARSYRQANQHWK